MHEDDPSSEVLPEGQSVHELAPALEYVPAAHKVQVPDPELEYVPAAQSVHTDVLLFIAEYFPAAHFSQSLTELM